VIEAEGRLTLDSFATINVVEAIEDRFGIRLLSTEVTRENFASLASLAKLIEEKRK
jgi:acyl carrier protein